MSAPKAGERARRWAKRPYVRRTALGIYVLLTAAVAVGGAWLIGATLGLSHPGCKDEQHAVLPDRLMLVAAVVALVLGRFLGYLRYDDSWHSLNQDERRQSEGLGIWAFIVFATAAAIALIYEAIGVQRASAPPVPSPEPITYYVRCAIYYDKTGDVGHGLITYAVICTISMLVGHWLWALHPPRQLPPEPGQKAGAE